MQHQSTTASQASAAAKQTIPIDTLRDCIDECRSCHDTCAQSLTYCLKEGGQHAEAGHIRLLLDCVEICQTSANFMLRGSPLHVHTCAACAEVCQACAEDCEQMGKDEQMRACAESCRRCAESCRRMAQMTH